jgi:hypothetical protein
MAEVVEALGKCIATDGWSLFRASFTGLARRPQSEDQPGRAGANGSGRRNVSRHSPKAIPAVGAPVAPSSSRVTWIMTLTILGHGRPPTSWAANRGVPSGRGGVFGVSPFWGSEPDQETSAAGTAEAAQRLARVGSFGGDGMLPIKDVIFVRSLYDPDGFLRVFEGSAGL